MEQADLDRQGEPAPGTALILDGDGSAAAAGGPARVTGPDGPEPAWRPQLRALTRHPVLTHLAVLAGFIAAGIAATWPRATDWVGRLPASRDAGSYVWGFWWVAHQVEHLGNPWFTRSIAAPVGAQLGLHALMPLPSALLIPITVSFGPSVSYNLLSITMPGLLCYAMYRVARLWLPSQAGAIAAGAFFGLSSMLTWRSWYHLNLAAGALFFPLALEAAVRLRRRPGWRQALVLGLVVGGALLTDQEMAVLVIILTGAALLPWLLRRPVAPKLWPAALAALVAVGFASPQIIAVIQQTRSGGATSPPHALGMSYVVSGVNLNNMFALSPRVNALGLQGHQIVYTGPTGDGISTFGLVLTVLAVLGLIVAWRRRSARLLALLWLGCAALALGSVLKVGPHIFIPAAKDVRRPSGIGRHAVHLVCPAPGDVRLPGGEPDHDARHRARCPARRGGGGLAALSRAPGHHRGGGARSPRGRLVWQRRDRYHAHGTARRGPADRRRPFQLHRR